MFYAVIHHPSSYSIPHGGRNCSCPGGLGAPGLAVYATRKERDGAVGQHLIRNDYGFIEKFQTVEAVTAAEATKRFGRKALLEVREYMGEYESYVV